MDAKFESETDTEAIAKVSPISTSTTTLNLIIISVI